MQYDFNLIANGAQLIDVAGRFFKYKSGLGLIRVRNSKGGYVDLLPGQGVSGLDFTSLNITDLSGAVNKGVLLAGDYEFRDDRITGAVDVVDGGKFRVLNNICFMTSRHVTAAPGTFATTQLWNPAGSNKNLYVNQISVGVDIASVVVCHPVNIELVGALRINVPSKKIIVGAIGESAGWYSNGSNSGISMEGLMTVSGYNRKIFELPLPANSTMNYKMSEPFLISHGYGINCQAQAIGTAGIFSSFEIMEEAI